MEFQVFERRKEQWEGRDTIQFSARLARFP